MTDLNENALKPCPFCGGRAKLYHRGDTTGWQGTDWVCCENDDCGCGTCCHETAESAISAWNRRAIEAATPPDVARLWTPAGSEHAEFGWLYDFEQIERITRAAEKATGYDATMEVVEFVMAEADRRHRDALAAKDAELAVQREAKEHARRLCDRAEARLAEASKALEQAEQQLDYGQVDAAHQILIRAVHRTLTEG